MIQMELIQKFEFRNFFEGEEEKERHKGAQELFLIGGKSF